MIYVASAEETLHECHAIIVTSYRTYTVFGRFAKISV